ncbi:MAG: CDP-diacylglycerol--glycerol-3-phosphate 3-phosphatidyltransferase [Bacilli bacterium]|nr:CDP-diacylglycerol--glycerol-3-phosphate 3-phosphatidyltransferase [Bacilli bacterium]
MNVPNRLTILRIMLTILIIILCLFPFYSIGIILPKFNIGGIVVESIYFISGIIFIIAAFTDYLDGSIARRENLVTDTGKLLDAIADKVLVNSVLIIFAVRGFIPTFVPVIYIFRDEVVNALKMDLLRKGKVTAAISSGKIKTASMMIGLGLMFFYNLPFELINLKIADFLIYFATIMSVVSGIEYYNMWKKVK